MSFVEEIVYLVQNIFISKLLKVSLMARFGDPVKNVTEKIRLLYWPCDAMTKRISSCLHPIFNLKYNVFFGSKTYDIWKEHCRLSSITSLGQYPSGIVCQAFLHFGRII